MKWYENPQEIRQFEIDNMSVINKWEKTYDWENMTVSCEIILKDKSKHIFDWVLDEKYYLLSGNSK